MVSDTDLEQCPDLYMIWHGDPGCGVRGPKGATPYDAFLVPAFVPCTAPNRTHGPPLAFDSCSPLASALPRLRHAGHGDGKSPPQGRSIGGVKLEDAPGRTGRGETTPTSQFLFSLTNVLWARRENKTTTPASSSRISM